MVSSVCYFSLLIMAFVAMHAASVCRCHAARTASIIQTEREGAAGLIPWAQVTDPLQPALVPPKPHPAAPAIATPCLCWYKP